MGDKVNKKLDFYVDGNNKQIAGKYHFKLPNGLEPECYPMEIQYESTVENKPEAYQYNGFVVIGHRSYLRTSPLIIPYNTTANREEDITVTEKMNTAFSAVVESFSDSDFETKVGNLPYRIHFVRSLFRDYHEDESTYNRLVKWDYDNSYVSTTLATNFKTNSTGTGTTNIKISDIYKSTETIHDLNTMIFKCIGTLDRGSNNYVPSYIETPLILGTTNVFIKLNTPQTRTVTIDGQAKTVPAICGKGALELGCDLIYEAFMRSDDTNYHMKYGYESYRTEPENMVHVGSLRLQYNDGSSWKNVPASELEAIDNHTTINSDGTIVQTPNKENGKIRVNWINTLPLNTRKNILYRWVYTGKVGATFGKTTTSYYIAIAPEYGEPRAFNTRVVLNASSFSGNPNTDIPICGKLQYKQGESWIDSTDGGGTITVSISDGTVKTGTVGNDGTFCVNVKTNALGEFTGVIRFHDPTGIYNDSRTTTMVTVSSITTAVELDNENLTVERGNPVSVSGDVVIKSGNNSSPMTNGKGTVTVTVGNTTKSVNVGSDGSFSTSITGLGCGEYTMNVSYHDSTNTYADSTDTIHLIIPYTSVIRFPDLSNNHLDVHNGTAYTVNAVIDVKDGSTVVTNIPINTTIKNPITNENVSVANGAFTLSNTKSGGNLVTGTNKSFTYTVSYAGTNLIKPSTQNLSITFKAFDVNIALPTHWTQVYDSGADDSEVFELKVSDSSGIPIREGNLKLKLKPVEYPELGEFVVWDSDITTRDTWNVNTYSSFNWSTMFNTLRNQGKLIYANYQLIGEYTAVSNKYNSARKVNYSYVRYNCKTPVISLTTTNKFMNNGTSSSFTPSTKTLNTTNYNDGLISVNYDLADDVTMVLSLKSQATGERFGGLEWATWFISEDEAIDMWTVDENGNLVLHQDGTPMLSTHVYPEIDYELPVQPTYPFYPILMPAYSFSSPDKYLEYNKDLTLKWKATFDQFEGLDHFYMYIVVVGHMGAIFPDGAYNMNHPWRSLENGVNADHTFKDPVDTDFNLVIKIKLNIHKAD